MLMSRRSKSFCAFCLLFLATQAWGQAIVEVEEGGRRVYVNDVAAVPAAPAAKARPRYTLVYWSNTEHRWKPVPGASGMRAAQTAAREVQQFLGMSGVVVPKLGAAAPATEAAPAST